MFPITPRFTLPTNQSTDHVSQPALRLTQIQRQTFFQRTAADDSESSVLHGLIKTIREAEAHLFTFVDKHCRSWKPCNFFGWYFPSENSNGLKC